MNEHNIYTDTNYPVYSQELDNIVDLTHITFPTKHIILFLSGDFRKLNNDQLSKLSIGLIDKGLLYVCVWGPDCSRAHDAFLLGNKMWERANRKTFRVLSSCHEDESLGEAIWFANFNAFVSPKLSKSTALVFAGVTRCDWSNVIEENLHNIKAFNEKMQLTT